ncbi:MAG: DUF58 domain-containing protein, partial [Terrimicrobiaceae bacterium]|nr:DUF58 domain-containing protein [Terrimicrobiaceae bacterium]
AVLVNASAERRTGLSLRPHRLRGARAIFLPQLGPRERATTTLELPPMPRGIHPLPALRLSTIHPQGLLYAWKIFHPEGELVVAPRPWGTSLAAHHGGSPPEGDPSEVRLRRADDAPSRTDWKILARTGKWMVREGPVQRPAEPLVFRWEQTAHLREPEERLGQLMLWVIEAREAGRPFILELGGVPVRSFPAACRRLAEYQP